MLDSLEPVTTKPSEAGLEVNAPFWSIVRKHPKAGLSRPGFFSRLLRLGFAIKTGTKDFTNYLLILFCVVACWAAIHLVLSVPLF